MRICKAHALDIPCFVNFALPTDLRGSDRVYIGNDYRAQTSYTTTRSDALACLVGRERQSKESKR